MMSAWSCAQWNRWQVMDVDSFYLLYDYRTFMYQVFLPKICWTLLLDWGSAMINRYFYKKAQGENQILYVRATFNMKENVPIASLLSSQVFKRRKSKSIVKFPFNFWWFKMRFLHWSLHLCAFCKTSPCVASSRNVLRLRSLLGFSNVTQRRVHAVRLDSNQACNFPSYLSSSHTNVHSMELIVDFSAFLHYFRCFLFDQ